MLFHQTFLEVQPQPLVTPTCSTVSDITDDEDDDDDNDDYDDEFKYLPSDGCSQLLLYGCKRPVDRRPWIANPGFKVQLGQESKQERNLLIRR